MWRVAEPNEALIISGLACTRARTDELEDEPRLQDRHRQGHARVPGRPGGAAALARPARGRPGHRVRHPPGHPARHPRRRHLQGRRRLRRRSPTPPAGSSTSRPQMDHRVHNVFAGHLRAIVGNMTVEEMIRDREKLTQLTRESSGTEMEKLGLIVDSLQIQEIEDPTGYIKNLGRPHAAAVESQARIAQADADRGRPPSGSRRPRPCKAEARRDSQVQAGRLPGRDRPRPRPWPARPVRCPRPRPARRSSSSRPGRRARGPARGAAAAGHRPQAGRRQGVRAGHAGPGRARRPHRRRRGRAPGGRAERRGRRPSG